MAGPPVSTSTSIYKAATLGFLSIVLLWIVPLPLFGQGRADSSARSLGSWVPSVRDIKQNAVDLATSPFDLSLGEQRLMVGAAGLLITVGATLDEPTYLHFSEGSHSTPSDAARRATASILAPGEWYDRRDANRFALQTVGALAASGVILRKPALTRASVRTVEAIVYADLATGLLKSVLNRSRPYVGDEPDAFAGEPGTFSSAHTQLAMPSGHAGRVFAIASVLAHESGKWYVALPLYAGASSVALERVHSGDHWLTDAVVGAAIGHFIGRTVSADQASRSLSEQRISYVPVLTLDRFGVVMLF